MIKIYIDGACTGNHLPPGVGVRSAGYGVFIDDLNDPTPKIFSNDNRFFISGLLEGDILTNNRAEIMAAIKALEIILETYRHCTVTIVCDSMLVHDMVTRWIPSYWRDHDYYKSDGNPVSNRDLVMRLDYLCQQCDNVSWQQMNSHKKAPTDTSSAAWRDWYGNRMADKLATAACK
jgi:ribonuclease HI